MPEEIFDQDRPRSLMAQRLDEAFAGCDEWTVAPPTSRRTDLDIAPWLGDNPVESHFRVDLADAFEEAFEEDLPRAA